MEQLRAGAAEVVITPPAGIDLTGYANRPSAAVGKHDDLYCRALVFEIQRYLAKAMYSISAPGAATALAVAWPALANYRVWQGIRNNYRWWIDETKPPFRSA